MKDFWYFTTSRTYRIPMIYPLKKNYLSNRLSKFQNLRLRYHWVSYHFVLLSINYWYFNFLHKKKIDGNFCVPIRGVLNNGRRLLTLLFWSCRDLKLIRKRKRRRKRWRISWRRKVKCKFWRIVGSGRKGKWDRFIRCLKRRVRWLSFIDSAL